VVQAAVRLEAVLVHPQLLELVGRVLPPGVADDRVRVPVPVLVSGSVWCGWMGLGWLLV
jgi:hypothetical protein